MAIIQVRKDGSGDALTIQQGIQLAAIGDVVDVGPGVFNENVDLWKGVTLSGAGMNLTTVLGATRTAITARAFVFVSGQATLNLTQAAIDSGITTADYEVGRVVTATGIPANTRIVSKTPTSLTLSAAVTASVTSRTVSMSLQNDATMRIRGTNGTVTGLKIVGFDHPNPATEYSAVYFRNTGLGSAAASGWTITNCEIEAAGEAAILTDFAAGVGNITIANNRITGKTFVGDNPAAGNQFTIWNVPRQLVAIQTVNSGVNSFINNLVVGITGGQTIDGVDSYNTAVSIDSVGAVVTGNTFEVVSGTGYSLRVRGVNSIVENNSSPGTSAGYYILPNYVSGFQFEVGDMVFSSSKYWVCIENHTSAANNAPTGVDGASFWQEITIEQVNASGVYGVGVQTLATNTSIFLGLLSYLQSNPGQPVVVSFDSDFLKSFSAVSSDPIFSNEQNWNLVGYVYKHSNSSKRLFVGMKNGQKNKPMKLRQAISGETYLLDKVILSTANRNFLVIKRPQINRVDRYDITLA